MRWPFAMGVVLVAWMTVQTIVVARHTPLESDELWGVAVSVVFLALVLSAVPLGAVIGFRWTQRRRLTSPSPHTMTIVTVAAGLLVCPIGVAPLPPEGMPGPARGQPCDALVPLPAAIWAGAAEEDPRLVYSDGCIFDL
jgi:hypothetical protein